MPLIPLFAILNSYALATSILQEEISSDFQDLGHLLLGGFVLAIAVAIALTLVRLRLRAKKPPTAQFISISQVDKEN
ncbi:MAG: hypothetical protein ACREBG_02425 [Pyrinomonadaceae bacterium]